MKILAADDEASALNILNRAVIDAVPGAELRSFSTASRALEALQGNAFQPDVAFLDIEMPGVSGLELAKAVKILCPNVNIVFVTGFSQYAIEALSQRPSGYVMKPATKEKILDELRNLRNPPRRTSEPKPVRIQCFGSFEAFINGEPIQFPRARSKELLAYLVDRRGASCSASEAAAILWDDGVYDRSRQKQFAVIRSELIRSLQLAGAESIIVKSHDSLSVNPEAFDCDYYSALEGDSVAINQFMGEYMAPYAWAEFTTGGLVSRYGTSQK
jgi:two-component system LytT family response regulator